MFYQGSILSGRIIAISRFDGWSVGSGNAVRPVNWQLKVAGANSKRWNAAKVSVESSKVPWPLRVAPSRAVSIRDAV